MTFGAKGKLVEKNGKLKQNYYTHCELDHLPITIKELEADNLTIKSIKWDKKIDRWKVKYFEYIKN